MKSAHVIPLSTDTDQRELIVVGYLVHCKMFAEVNRDNRIETLTRVMKKIIFNNNRQYASVLYFRAIGDP